MRLVLLLTSLLLALLLPASTSAARDGRAHTRVVGGVPASADAAPFAASLSQRYPRAASARARHRCTGSMIAPQVLLTAAHCLDGLDEGEDRRALEVVAGARNLHNGLRLRIVRSVVHPEYAGTRNDIALIRVAAPTPGPLATLAQSRAILPLGGQTTVAGWGVTSNRGSAQAQDRLRSAVLHRVPTRGCRRMAWEWATVFDPATALCVSGDRQDSCQGDSGGPLVAGGQLIGVVSFGAQMCGRGQPTAYTDVTRFRTWLAATTAEFEAG